MRLNIINIGNSQGLRLPKTLLTQCGIRNAVNIKVEDQALVITPYKKGRDDWEKSFQKMADVGDDHLLDAELLGLEWEQEEWQW